MTRKISINEKNAKAYFNKIAGILPTKGKLAKMLLKERARDKAREENKRK